MAWVVSGLGVKFLRNPSWLNIDPTLLATAAAAASWSTVSTMVNAWSAWP